MARIRTVKPEFFKHHDLYLAEKECGLPLRVGFQGLWICADKEGRFKWRPAALKLDALPYDECDFEDVLIELAIAGFIVKYMAAGKEYGYIPSFRDHQRITGSEVTSESRIPDPKSGITLETPRKHQGNTLDDWKGKEGKGKEGNGVMPKMTKEDFVAFQAQLIQDNIFIEQLMCAKGIRELSVMLGWIKAFNVHIAGDGKLEKDFEEYRRHFKNWIGYQETSKPPPVVLNGAISSTIKPVTEETLQKYRQKNV